MKQTTLIICLISVFVASCGSNKEGQLKPASKIYQNTTARYNGYFNGKELVNKSEQVLNESYVDNYNQILPLYPYIAIENASSVSSDLDAAMEKATVVVNLHPKSYWVDDCYYLLGKSQFFKKEYEAAEHTFEYMLEEFHPDNLEASVVKYGEKYGPKEESKKRRTKKPEKVKKTSNRKKRPSKKVEEKKEKSEQKAKAKTREERLEERKRKKKESQKEAKKSLKERAEVTAEEAISQEENEGVKKQHLEEKAAETDDDQPGYFLKHRPVYAEANLWLAKTYAAHERYADALFRLSQVENDPFSTEDILEQVHKIRAFTYLQKGELDNAIEPLKMATEYARKKDKARMLYILGQVYQEQNKGALASETFAEVARMHPTYEMEFNARLNSLRSEWGQDVDVQERTTKLLERMLKDEKNEEYLDQIYFALGELFLQRGMTKEANESFRKAATTGSGNSIIQTEAYLILGQNAYHNGDYVTAAGLYDTTLNFMSIADSRFNDTKEINTNLTDVAAQLLEISLQDSLMMIAGMTAEEQRAFAFKLKQKELDDQKNAALADARFDANSIKKASTSKFSKGVTFFAYNDKALKKGQKDFKKRWRNRNNTDDWRRSNKLTSDIDEGEEIDIEDLRAEEMTQEEVDEILADVPKTKEQRERSNEDKMRATYLVAGFYDSRLGEIDKSIDAYEEFLRLYPNSPFSEEAYYALYQSYTRTGEIAKATQIKNKLSAYNPESKFVKIINDPDYFKDTNSDESVVAASYDQAYNLFEKGNVEAALNKVKSVEASYSIPANFKPRFALLSALCEGGIKGKDVYITMLEGVVKDHPTTDESKRAKEILRHLRGDGDVFTGAGTASRFEAQKNRLHYLLIVFKDVPDNIKINKLRALVSDYNIEYHKLEKLRVGNVFLSKDDKEPILIVRKFNDADAAMVYYTSIELNKANFMNDYNYELLVINQRNYREILRSKSLEDYKEFFKENYLE